jgi:uncharacterized membrane protein
MRELLDSGTGRRLVVAVAALALAAIVGLILLWPAGAGEVQPASVDAGPAVQAEVTAVEATPCQTPGATGCQTVSARILGGADEGATAEFVLGEASSDPDLAIGQVVTVGKNPSMPGAEPGSAPPYSLRDLERRGPLLWLAIGFGLLVVLFGRLRGAMALVGLGASLVLVFAFIVPGMLEGKPPVAVAAVGSITVMLITIALAHGLGAKSLAAMLGTAISLALTVALAVVFSDLTHLTGLGGEAASFVMVGGGGVSLQGIVIAGMVIGALGVLDDVTVSQASTVMALRRANPDLTSRQLYREALAVGHDHVAATVNTLVLAYVGAALPILLVFSIGGIGVGDGLNSEAVAEQIVAMLVGSTGLIAAVPVTTLIAATVAVRLAPGQLADAHAGHAH